MKKRSTREVSLLLYRSRKKMAWLSSHKKKSQKDSRPKGSTIPFPIRKVICRSGNNEYNAVGIPIKPPADFSLERNADEILLFLEKLREQYYLQSPQPRPNLKGSHRRWIGYYADFTPIENIATAAALVLAAEFYRLKDYSSKRQQHKQKASRLALVDFHKWKNRSISTLYNLGFLDLLDVCMQENEVPDKGYSDKRIQKFMTGNRLDPPSVSYLRDRLAILTNKLEAAEDIKLGIYDGLSEAMTNTLDHAYQDAQKHIRFPILNGQWWMTGSVTNCGSEIEVVFFDQGISIPCHLPKNKGEYLREYFREYFNPSAQDDAMMIKAAMEINRSSTNEKNRGKGLSQIQNLIKLAPKGKLRILSRKGEYIYNKVDGKKPSVNTRTLEGDIGGTLIHWHLNVQPG